jgi:hypothetical protein
MQFEFIKSPPFTFEDFLSDEKINVSSIDQLQCATSSQGVIIPNGEYGSYQKGSTSPIGGTLDIKNSSINGFDFEIQVIGHSYNVGDLGGKACRTNKENIFLFKDVVPNYEKTYCKAIFEYDKKLQKISLSTENNTCSDYAGNNVYFGDNYVKDRKPEIFTVDSLKTFINDIERNSFAKLVGDKLKDFDGKDAEYTYVSEKLRVREAFSYGGLAYGGESLIVIDDKGNIWALVDDYDIKTDRSVVRYFTNVQNDTNYIPEWLGLIRNEVSFCDGSENPLNIIFESAEGKPVELDKDSKLCNFG